MFLNPYQQQIVQHLANDYSIKEIAAMYKQPYQTITDQIREIRKRHNCQTNIALVLKALEHEVITWPGRGKSRTLSLLRKIA